MRKAYLILFTFLLCAAVTDLLGGKKQFIQPNSAEEVALLEAVRSSDPADRVARLDSFVQRFPQAAVAAEAHYLRNYVEMQQWDQALAHGRKAFDADNEDYDVAADLMKANQGKGDLDAAVQWGCTAGTLLSKEISEGAESSRQESLRAARDRVEYETYTTALKQPSGRRTRALEQVMAAFPGGRYAKVIPGNLATAYQLAGNNARAIALAQKAVEVEPDNEAMHLLLAETYLAQGRLELALQHARNTVRILASHPKPDNMSDGAWAAYVRKARGGANSVSGRVLMQQEKTDAAIPDLVAASQSLEDTPEALAPVLYNLAFAYAKKGQWAYAQVTVDRAVQIPGPFQALSQDLRDRIRRATAAPRK